MDELPSSEFRKRFHRLRYPTKVTVNGHLIGVWMPANVEPTEGMRLPISRVSVPVPERADWLEQPLMPTAVERVVVIDDEDGLPVPDVTPGATSNTTMPVSPIVAGFHPVPKPAPRGKRKSPPG